MMISHSDNHIKRLRLKAGLTVEEVAKKAKISESTIYAYEEGRRKPKPTVAEILSNIYDCTIEEILKG